MATDTNINITTASLRGSPSDRIIKPRPRKDSLQSISGSDTHPGRVVKPRARKSPGSGAKRSEPAKRKFICSFSHYGCDVALSSKNEWKRHVSIQHLQLGFYRCDVGSCNPDLNTNVPNHKRVYNDFNRKDLFTQHHRRMHKPETGPGSGPIAPGNAGDKDWRAFEDSLEEVRSRCWMEKRKPPQRSTCGFCGRVFEGEGSWNERMEHVGGHFSRDIVEAKEEREDEDLTNWALQEGIIKDAGNGRHVLVDQPPTISERPYSSRDRDVAMTDAPSSDGVSRDPEHSPSLSASSRRPESESNYPKLDSPREARRLSNTMSPNGTPRAPSVPLLQPAPGSSVAGQSIAPALAAAALGSATVPDSPENKLQPPPTPPERRGYNLAPPPLQGGKPAPGTAAQGDSGSGDRLEDLINQLIRPKPPKTHRRLTWKCDCNLEMSVDIDDADRQAIESLQDISIICSKTSNPYLKVAKTGKYHVVACDELAGYIWKNSKQPVEQHNRPSEVPVS
ncbi:uncharacterized protein PV07_09665 [Cladophialophora immunda]|uniref:C2H2-type domain-containing protein n=1 Tax=Cladophialophora immunda TaxID=569365 RepID=A0A0D2ANB4_9EURO|nr:uncharacterized protein PV07_09665 [Cladophialophora immunda]KIW26582.1 hypothetical protein PV07_09665 [Cladophialophora immunda]OQV02451.1 hypothetical protein CLAIMM_07649 [Cladophialophora immunda]